MKNVLSLVFLLTYLNVFSQSIFDKYEEKQEVISMVVSQKMFDIFSKIEAKDKEAQDFMRIAKNLSGLRVFVTENQQVAQQMNADVLSYQRSANLSSLTRMQDKGTKINFYIKEGTTPEHMSELLMVVDKASTFMLVNLTGNISFDDIKFLVKKMDLPKELESLNL